MRRAAAPDTSARYAPARARREKLVLAKAVAAERQQIRRRTTGKGAYFSNYQSCCQAPLEPPRAPAVFARRLRALHFGSERDAALCADVQKTIKTIIIIRRWREEAEEAVERMAAEGFLPTAASPGKSGLRHDSSTRNAA